MRIVSLLPSTTEILFAIGAGPDVVGVTFECDYPAAARSRRIVSTTTLTGGLSPAEIDREVRARIAAGEDLYSLDAGALHEIDPTLVITQDLCAICAIDVADVDTALRYLGCSAAVLTVQPHTLVEVLDSIETISETTGRQAAGRDLLTALQARLDQVRAATGGQARPRIAVVEWTDPPFTTGHWVPDLIDVAGGNSVLGDSGSRSVETSWAAVAASRPDIIVIAPCGFRLPAALGLARELVAAGVLPPGVPVWAVDADAAFVRPGPRLVDGVEALAAIFHPDLMPGRIDLARQV